MGLPWRGADVDLGVQGCVGWNQLQGVWHLHVGETVESLKIEAHAL